MKDETGLQKAYGSKYPDASEPAELPVDTADGRQEMGSHYGRVPAPL